jgi:tRNA G18 (ribose-2'-O)-methylase SpoU
MVEILTIDDPDDPRIAAYRAIREGDLVGRHGQFIAEGEVVLNVLLSERSLHPTRSLLLSDKRVGGLSNLLARVPDGIPVYAARQPVLDAISGFHIHRGVLALGERTSMPDTHDLLAGLGHEALVVALAGIANHDNMGGICRNAAAFGADAVLLDGACVDPFYRKAIRVSVGGALTLPFAAMPAGAAALDLLAEHGFGVLALSPSGMTALADLEPAPRVAVMFGTEGPGLPRSVLDGAKKVRIEMARGMDSLNVATASGIVLHHLRRRQPSSKVVMP